MFASLQLLKLVFISVALNILPHHISFKHQIYFPSHSINKYIFLKQPRIYYPPNSMHEYYQWMMHKFLNISLLIVYLISISLYGDCLYSKYFNINKLLMSMKNSYPLRYCYEKYCSAHAIKMSILLTLKNTILLIIHCTRFFSLILDL
jgi:hypothetical protein